MRGMAGKTIFTIFWIRAVSENLWPQDNTQKGAHIWINDLGKKWINDLGKTI